MKPFLKAEWRKLAMANYAVPVDLIKPFIPTGTEIDTFNNTCYVSLVGFMFLNTKVIGLKIPFHVNFEEVNLRYYVRYKNDSEIKRGVGFIKEIVPRAALTMVANLLYSEKYVTLPMSHTWEINNDELSVEYNWKTSAWNSFKVISSNTPTELIQGSEAEFILEHYWGYTTVNKNTTYEYQVEHPRWKIYPVKNFNIDVNFSALYGEPFAFLKNEKPISVFLAEGSEVMVYKKKVLRF